MATLIYGSIQDADYSTLGYVTVQALNRRPDVGRSAFSEKVGASDAERVMEEYIASGYDIIWAHSSIYTNAVNVVADRYPEISFILEGDSKPAPEAAKPNVWLIDRNYYTGFYVIGQLAALQTETGKVAFEGAVKLPFQIGIANAIRQGIEETDPSVEFTYIFVGDFDDPVLARQTTEALIARGNDVIMSALNLGNYGIFEAVQGKKVYVTTVYTDKQNFGPENFMTSEIFDFET
ncbi:MAG: BMP family ABC transporter substrate-binding protein, partial [Spirochaetaceae bacterium]|nr:BMP family ABC transporter substrate-binding protein [Spirochaetaceae bacterium]